jgi:alpha-galactosidase
MKKVKIAYVGGGSKQWARVFMYDLALCSDFTGEIGLYDIDIESAKINQQIGAQINKAKETINQWNYVVYETLDECLKSADFVVISILVSSGLEYFNVFTML